MMDRDRITRTVARAPGVERRVPLSWRRHTKPASSTLIEGQGAATGDANVRCKPEHGQGTPGDGLTCECKGKALTERPALEPYWGKPAVRNLRGDDGTSASFEARSAPSSYSTALVVRCRRGHRDAPARSEFESVVLGAAGGALAPANQRTARTQATVVTVSSLHVFEGSLGGLGLAELVASPATHRAVSFERTGV
jgi:hypothetical protein